MGQFLVSLRECQYLNSVSGLQGSEASSVGASMAALVTDSQ